MAILKRAHHLQKPPNVISTKNDIYRATGKIVFHINKPETWHTMKANIRKEIVSIISDTLSEEVIKNSLKRLT